MALSLDTPRPTSAPVSPPNAALATAPSIPPSRAAASGPDDDHRAYTRQDQERRPDEQLEETTRPRPNLGAILGDAAASDETERQLNRRKSLPMIEMLCIGIPSNVIFLSVTS